MSFAAKGKKRNAKNHDNNLLPPRKKLSPKNDHSPLNIMEYITNPSFSQFKGRVAHF